MTATPALHHLIGAYVNLDCLRRLRATSGPPWTTSSLGTPEHARALPAEIAMLLETYPPKTRWRPYLDELGVGYIADPDEGGYRGWLIEVSRRVQAAISAS